MLPVCASSRLRLRIATGAAMAAFVAGSVVSPVVHAIHHRPDHVHGPVSGGEPEDESLQADRPVANDGLGALAHFGFVSGGESREPSATSRHSRPPKAPSPNHGHGSVEHFGLAMLGARVTPGPIVATPLAQLAHAAADRAVPVHRYLLAPLWSQGPPA